MRNEQERARLAKLENIQNPYPNTFGGVADIGRVVERFSSISPDEVEDIMSQRVVSEGAEFSTEFCI